MICPLCQNENLTESNFCGFCGKLLPNLPQIPKPEGDISDAEKSINDAETLVEKIRDENSPEHLKKIFEDAEFILDEILIEKKPDEFETSRPIIKPSMPLMNK
ncbi:MAG TPA: hypothetical protein PKE69_08420 [Pyrinomonadaceae bacterium]|nr:hypothetical protein [Pyrinomonadaceae bacterium]